MMCGRQVVPLAAARPANQEFWMSPRNLICAVICIVAFASTSQTADAQDVLSEKSYWRVYATWRTPTLVDKDGKLKPLYDPKTKKPLPVVASPPPAKNWMAPDFDDTSWGKSRGRFFFGAAYRGVLTTVGGRAELRGVYLRGKFHVKNPKRVMMMKLYVSYVGGAVAYVNGKELQRGHLPALSSSKGPEGEFGPDTLAERYPDKHYIRPDGKLLHELTDPKHEKNLVEKEWHGRFRGRVRELPPKGWLEAVAIPSSMLRKGVNVIAIANCSAPISEARLTGKFGKTNFRGNPAPWAHAGVHAARVHVAPGPALTPNIQRPEGIQLWNRRIARRVFASDYGDPYEPLRFIRLIGVRNGAFSGQVVLGTTGLIEGLKAAATSL